MQPGMTGDERGDETNEERIRGEIHSEQLHRHDCARERHMRRRTENGDEAECRSRDDRQSEYGCTCRSERSTHDEQRCHLPANESRPCGDGREHEFQK